MIKIKPSPTADTRTAKTIVSEDGLERSTAMHRHDVSEVMHVLAKVLTIQGEKHDYTKVSKFKEFYAQFHNAQLTGEWGAGWYDEIHVKQERHHLLDNCPEDVNLLDVIEMIVDCVVAGIARSGEYRPFVNFPNHILQLAMQNTEKLLVNSVTLDTNVNSKEAKGESK